MFFLCQNLLLTAQITTVTWQELDKHLLLKGIKINQSGGGGVHRVACGTLVSQLGSELMPLQWKCGAQSLEQEGIPQRLIFKPSI